MCVYVFVGGQWEKEKEQILWDEHWLSVFKSVLIQLNISFTRFHDSVWCRCDFMMSRIVCFRSDLSKSLQQRENIGQMCYSNGERHRDQDNENVVNCGKVHLSATTLLLLLFFFSVRFVSCILLIFIFISLFPWVLALTQL